MNPLDDLKQMTLEEVCSKYKMSFKELVDYANNKAKNGDESISLIKRIKNRYYIVNSRTDKPKYIGSFLNKNEARQLSRAFNILRESHPNDVKYLGDKWIHKVGNRWKIEKRNSKGAICHFGRFDSQDEARKVRDYLFLNGWDLDVLKEVLDKKIIER